MPEQNRTFYLFLGLHSLLIGIFPFYLPVYLWRQGFDISAISVFISLSGLGFILGMWVWDRLRWRINLISVMFVSFLLELVLLVFAPYLFFGTGVLITLALLYGCYNSFFWTTQRALFYDLVTVENTGRKYGNFQIFVGLSLQIGILIGGSVLETTSFMYLVYVSLVIIAIGMVLLWRLRPQYPATLTSRPSILPNRVFRFKDREASKLIFIIDGFYLFLESFFWVITLFLLARESFSTLGLLVMGLAVIFGILFYLLKNFIDQFSRNTAYIVSVVLYAASWGLRALIDNQWSLEVLFFVLVLITFFTSYFRLAMNKRFYDLAKTTIAHDYLIIKSYYTQASIAVCFIIVAGVSLFFEQPQEILIPVYWVAGILAPCFLWYGTNRYGRVAEDMLEADSSNIR